MKLWSFSLNVDPDSGSNITTDLTFSAAEQKA